MSCLDFHSSQSNIDLGNTASLRSIPKLGSNVLVEQRSTRRAGSYATEHHINLSRTDEDHLLEQFWLFFQWRLPDLDIAAFKVYHSSLWEPQHHARRSSPLVDILLALAIQSKSTSSPSNDMNIQAHSLYRRCQALLADELDGPSIQTFHCYLLSAMWLYNASHLNVAHSMLATCIRNGVILGLHLEPSSDLPSDQKAIRRRLWWLAYAFEMKMGMELGRPLAVNFSQVSCNIPTSLVSPVTPEITAFHTHFITLTLATRAIYITFYRECARVLRTSNCKVIHQDPMALEATASFLQSKTTYLETWIRRLPQSFKTPRNNLGQPFSTDRSTLTISPISLPWLIQQRLLLELLYHDYSMSLHRPFISFNRSSHHTPSSPTPNTLANALVCLNHAITTTSILHQLLTETNLLSGWHEPVPLLWNATISIIGYILAHPDNINTPTAREALRTSITTFSLLAPNFPNATRAEAIVHEWSSKLDTLFGTTREADDDTTVTSTNHDASSTFPGNPAFDFNAFHLDDFTDPAAFQDPVATGSTSAFPANYTYAFDSMGGFGDDSDLFNFLDFGDMSDIGGGVGI